MEETILEKLCDYGCGQKAKYYFKSVDKWCCSDYFNKCPIYKQKYTGKNNPMFGKPVSIETRLKISSKAKGKKRSKEACKNISEAKTGKTREPFSDEWKKNLSISKKGISKPFSESHKNNLIKKLKGRKFSIEARKNLSIRRMGSGNNFYGKHHSDITKEKLSKKSIEKWEDKDSIYHTDEYWEKIKISRNLKPNKPETIILRILEQLYSKQWKYTGDFSLWINGKNPDFTNESKKLIIEFFGEYFHKEEDEDVRKKIFKESGYSTLIIWERELSNISKIILKIKNFIGE